jgi:hypothetical protein
MICMIKGSVILAIYENGAYDLFSETGPPLQVATALPGMHRAADMEILSHE